MLDNVEPSMTRRDQTFNMGTIFKKFMNNSDVKNKGRKSDDLVPSCFPCKFKKSLRLQKQRSCMPFDDAF